MADAFGAFALNVFVIYPITNYLCSSSRKYSYSKRLLYSISFVLCVFYFQLRSQNQHKNAYQLLELSYTGDVDFIQNLRKEYKRMLLQTHPDKVNAGGKVSDNSEFLLMKASYDILMDDNKRIVYNKYGLPSTELLFPTSNNNEGNSNSKRNKKSKQSGIKLTDFQKFRKGILLQSLLYYCIQWVMTFYTTISENSRVSGWCYFGLGCMFFLELYIQQVDVYHNGVNITAYYVNTSNYIVSFLHTIQSFIASYNIPYTIPLITEYECIHYMRLFYPLYMNSICRSIIPSLSGYVLPSDPLFQSPIKDIIINTTTAPTTATSSNTAVAGNSTNNATMTNSNTTNPNPANPTSVLPKLFSKFSSCSIDPVNYTYSHCCLILLNNNILCLTVIPAMHTAVNNMNKLLEESRLNAIKVESLVSNESNATSSSAAATAAAASSDTTATNAEVKESYHWSIYILIYMLLRLIFYSTTPDNNV